MTRLGALPDDICYLLIPAGVEFVAHLDGSAAAAARAHDGQHLRADDFVIAVRRGERRARRDIAEEALDRSLDASRRDGVLLAAFLGRVIATAVAFLGHDLTP